MLAYVFWHLRQPTVAASEYEAAHRAFHESLWATPVAGLLGLCSYRLPEVPWLVSGKGGYEDWHLLEGSAGLDVLNEAAVTRARLAVHDRIAGMAANGTAGLYGLRSGVRIEPTFAYWMSKPAGMTYTAFDESLKPLIAKNCCLWSRRMTLGPTPEFCLHAPAAVSLPHEALALKIELLHSHGVTSQERA